MTICNLLQCHQVVISKGGFAGADSDLPNAEVVRGIKKFVQACETDFMAKLAKAWPKRNKEAAYGAWTRNETAKWKWLRVPASALTM